MRRSPAATMLALAVVLVVLAGALILFTKTKKKPVEAPEAAPANPFADLPPEPPPAPRKK